VSCATPSVTAHRAVLPKNIIMKKLFPFLCLLLSLTTFAQSPTYDLVLKGGQVIDPETELNAIRNVGINGDKIVEISQQTLNGKEVIDVTGLVVSPGFIDLHVHGMTNKAHEYQVRDGVTTALELEGGRDFLREWLASKAGNSIVNYGATVPHSTIRAMAMQQYQPYVKKARKLIALNGFGTLELTKLMINLGMKRLKK